VARLPRTKRCEGRGGSALVMLCSVMLLFVYCRVGKNRDTGGGHLRVPGRAVALATQRFSLVTQLSRHEAAIGYTDLLAQGCYYKFGSISGGQLFYNNLIYLLFRLC
jgi:hypothetical protein